MDLIEDEKESRIANIGNCCTIKTSGLRDAFYSKLKNDTFGNKLQGVFLYKFDPHYFLNNG
ncbi:MAG: hypothetical protein IPL95_11175 [Saprospiraceae bacterium]|nr:hypothetical protein [Saprospiraceae bacterium]